MASRLWGRAALAVAIVAAVAGGRWHVPLAAEGGPARAGQVVRNSIGMELVLIPAGTFQMGSEDGGGDDQPVHEVRITKPFHLGATEVTNAQWKAVMAADPPSKWKDDAQPVECVSWLDAVAFCERLSALPDERAAGRVYRLPTEAEWEYACRAGSETDYAFGDDAAGLLEHGWSANNSGVRVLDADGLLERPGQYFQSLVDNGCQTHSVGQKKPNAWALHDMHGNVWEWCSDWYASYAAAAASDPTGPADGSLRVLRGGCWQYSAWWCRSAARYGGVPSFHDSYVGFRIALSPSGTEPPEADGR